MRNRKVFGMARRRGILLAAGGTLALLAALVLTGGAVGAQEESGLTPAFGDGRLVVSGAGFRPGERVTVSARVDGGVSQERVVVADGQGRFRLDTGLPVRPGASVALEARGEQGTVKAAITGVPALPPPPAGPATPGPAPTAGPQPTSLPRTGGLGPTERLTLAAVAGGAMLLGGIAFGRRGAGRKTATTTRQTVAGDRV